MRLFRGTSPRDSNPSFSTDDDADVVASFSVLSEMPIALRPEYAASLQALMRAELAAQGRKSSAPEKKLSHRPVSPRPLWFRPMFAAGMAAMVVALVLSIFVAGQFYWWGGGQHATTLVVYADNVRVARDISIIGDIALTRQFNVAAHDSLRLRAGDKVISGRNAEAEILFPDNSRVSLAPGTELSFRKLQTRTDSQPLDVAMFIESGGLRSQVTTLRPETERFEVSTPNLIAHVKGTVFRVDVRSEGTRVATDEGAVQVQLQDREFEVTAGRELEVLLGAQAPEIKLRLQAPKLVFEQGVAKQIQPTPSRYTSPTLPSYHGKFTPCQIYPSPSILMAPALSACRLTLRASLLSSLMPTPRRLMLYRLWPRCPPVSRAKPPRRKE